MDTKVIAILELSTDEVGQRPNTHLQTGPVRHQLGNCLTDGGFLRATFALRQLEQRHVVLDDRVNLRDMQFGPHTVDSRHVPVDLDDQTLRGPGYFGGVVVAEAEAEVAVAVHRRDGYNESVDADLVDHQARGLVEVVRNVVEDLAATLLQASLDQRAVGGGNE